VNEGMTEKMGIVVQGEFLVPWHTALCNDARPDRELDSTPKESLKMVLEGLVDKYTGLEVLTVEVPADFFHDNGDIEDGQLTI
jgi:hypothetical protein